MSDIAAPAAMLRPPTMLLGPWQWVRTNLFNSWLSTTVTLAIGYLLVRGIIGFVDWAIVHAV